MKLFEKEAVVELNDKNRALLQDALRVYIDNQEECPVCYDVPDASVITHCKHIFCRRCILEVIKRQHACPICRNKLEEDCLLEPAPTASDEDENEDFDGELQSSKTEALLQIVRATLKRRESKVIIFSQWTSFLNIVQKLLEDAGIEYMRIDGTMTVDKRDRAIQKLDHDPDTRIMLASLAVCSVGLNLVAADTVILSDSCKSTTLYARLFHLATIPLPTLDMHVLLLIRLRVGSCYRGSSSGSRPPPWPNA